MKTSNYSKNFVITLVILPTLVELVIFMVNGSLGTSVAVLGAFSLIRFRSLPGNSKEITSIFFAMAIGLAVGMGQILFAILMTIVIGFILLICSKTHFGEGNQNEQILKILIPENLDYTNLLEDLWPHFTEKKELEKVKTTDMGSLFELTYRIKLQKGANEKEFIDAIRCRNGNLKIVLERPFKESEL